MTQRETGSTKEENHLISGKKASKKKKTIGTQVSERQTTVMAKRLLVLNDNLWNILNLLRKLTIPLFFVLCSIVFLYNKYYINNISGLHIF